MNIRRLAAPAAALCAATGATGATGPGRIVIGAVVAVVVGLVLRLAPELPRLYWMTHYTRLVKKGAALATTAAEIERLIAALATAQRNTDCQEHSG
ncbi:hypothetical protein [Streptomyces sp. NPDC005336]|uniref:hypothetical protein n=1 Tax=unclassified Streptomyces TaxID=2593676 RepID=UPI0033A4C737